MSGYRDLARGKTHDLFETALGWVGVVVEADGRARRASLPAASRLQALESIGPDLGSSVYDVEAATEIRDMVMRYCEGEAVDLTRLPVDVDDAPAFFRRAWAACRSIPSGETRSYAWLAERAGNARAARVAGQAMAKNRLPLLVPCHRVVGSDGSLHGFGGGGLPLKACLLELEFLARSPGQ